PCHRSSEREHRYACVEIHRHLRQWGRGAGGDQKQHAQDREEDANGKSQIHFNYQKITFNTINATETTAASGSGRRYHGSWASVGISVSPYTSPRSSSSFLGAVTRLTRIVTTKHTDHAQ